MNWASASILWVRSADVISRRSLLSIITYALYQDWDIHNAFIRRWTRLSRKRTLLWLHGRKGYGISVLGYISLLHQISLYMLVEKAYRLLARWVFYVNASFHTCS